MEDFVVDQAKYLSRILAANAKDIEEKRVVSEHFTVHPVSVMDQAQILQAAVRDSVMLHQANPPTHECIVLKSDFSLLQNQLLGIALQDRARLQDAAVDSITELQSIRPQFVLEVAEILESVLRDNAEAATEGIVDSSKLDMCKPWEVANLVKRLRHLLEYHIRHLEALTRSKREADDHTVQLRTEIQDTIAQYTVAQAKILELEAALRALQQGRQDAEAQCTAAQAMILDLENVVNALRQENEQVKVAADVADAATQLRITKLRKELETLEAAHLQCENKLQQRDTEIAQLNEGYKTLIRSNEEREGAANDSDVKVAVKAEGLQSVCAERDTLATDLSELRCSFEQFRLERGQDIKNLIKENEQLRKRVEASDVMETRSTELKGMISQLESELEAIKTQLMSSDAERDTWKTAWEDVLSRNAADRDTAATNAAQQRALLEEGDRLLQNAARKIEDLEQTHREKDQEISRLRDVLAQKNDDKGPPAPNPSPASAHKLGSLLPRKRKATASGKAAASWSQGDNGIALNLAAHGSQIPPEREAMLASLPVAIVNLAQAPEIFTRQSLSNILGGSIQGLVVRCTNSATDLARRYDITDYLCPNMDHNAWSPAGPGKHGYVQVGLGRDRKLFNGEGEYRHVFVGGGKFFLYCGWYHVLRVDPLTKEEWDTLPPKVKTTYSETTFNKENTRDCTNKELWSTIKSVGQVVQMYNKGELRAPLVRLQCLKFDMDFYQELIDANARYFTNKQRPAPPNATKRRKVADDTKEEEDKAEDDVPMTLIDDKAEGEQPAMPVNDTAASLDTPSTEAIASSSTQPGSVDPPVALVPPTPEFLASAGMVIVDPSSPSRQTRHETRQQSSSGLRLRIPGGRSPRSSTKDTEDTREVEDGLLSGASDSEYDEPSSD